MFKPKSVGIMALIIFAIAIVLVGDGVGGEKENLKIIERNNNEVWNQQKFAVVDEIVAENYVRHDLASGQDIRGREAYIENIKQTMAFKWVFIPETLIASGDYAAGRFSGIGIDPATAKPVKFTCIIMFRLKDGKLVEDWVQYDNLGLLQQLGYKLVPPPEK
jgi:predicted ester cyclase